MSDCVRAGSSGLQNVAIQLDSCHSEFHQQQNPLLNSLILQNVFDLLSWKEIKTCRMVCKAWHRESEKEWLRKGPIMRFFDGNAGEEKKKEFTEMNKEIKLEHYRWNGIQKYLKFELVDFIMDEIWMEKNEFWRQIGRSVTMLKLTDCEFGSVSLLRKIITCEATPKLECLEINLCLLNKTKPQGGQLGEHNAVLSMHTLRVCYEEIYFAKFPISWKEIFQCFPNLKNLSLELDGSLNDQNNEIKRVFKGLKYWQRNIISPRLPLKSLEFNKQAPFPVPMLKYLRNDKRRKLMLERLTIGVKSENDPPLLYETLVYQNEIQRLHLHAFLHSNTSAVHLYLPFLEKLVHLKLFDLVVDSLSFLQSCPNLKFFEINPAPGRVHEYYGNVPGMVRSLKGWNIEERISLRLSYIKQFSCGYAVKYETLDVIQLSRWMPNINCLKLHLDNVSFRAVCRYFPRLGHLTIYCSLVTDAGIIGEDDIHCVPMCFLNEAEERRKGRLYPCLANLKDLKRLSISWCNYGHKCYGEPPTILTYLSVLYGFRDLFEHKKLLGLYLSPEMITLHAARILETYFPGFDSEENRQKFS